MQHAVTCTTLSLDIGYFAGRAFWLVCVMLVGKDTH